MDSLTHLVAGALTPLAFRTTPRRTALVLFGILAGEFPDIDAFFARGTPEGVLLIHRGITHALLLQPILMLVLVLPFFIWVATHPLKASTAPHSLAFAPAVPLARPCVSCLPASVPSVFLLCAIALPALFIHIWLDCMTTFGTQALQPFSAYRVALPSMFIIDLCILVPIALFLGAALYYQGKNIFYSARSRTLARLGLAWILVYPLISLGINTVATHAVARQLHVQPNQVKLLTVPFSPFAWKGVLQENTDFTVFNLSATAPSQPKITSRHKAPAPELVHAFIAQVPIFEAFTAFSSHMVQEERPAPFALSGKEPLTLYTFKDLRYIAMAQDVSRRFRLRGTPFVFEVLADKYNSVRAFRYLPREGDTPSWQFPD